ncbi:MAG TPA: HAD hydrolase-like protein [Blastocatellia bacterium]|jgi:phosphoglycolate phosphatase-like HAD superfamily hydrolase
MMNNDNASSARHWRGTDDGGFPRAILFDIDGTLIKAARRPEYRGRMREMLLDVFGTCGRISEIDFGGKTDLAIYREALECEGVTPELIREQLPRLEQVMVDMLYDLASTGEVFQLCPGVRELLDALTVDPRFISSLLTGNVERLAEAKLRIAGIWHYFRDRGAFGGDAEERDHLPAIAAARINERLGRALDPRRFIIIGDTPLDIKCARHFGARVVAVASGQHTVDQLSRFAPDAMLQDLSQTDALLNLLGEI